MENFLQILTDEIIGKEATKLYDDANAFLKKIINEKWLTAKGVVGFWEAECNCQMILLTVKNENGKNYILNFCVSK